MSKNPFTSQAAILQVLAANVSYGYDIARLVKQRTGGVGRIGEGNLYQALTALEGKGLVTGFPPDEHGQSDGPPRIYYELTAAGREMAREHRRIAAGLFCLTE